MDQISESTIVDTLTDADAGLRLEHYSLVGESVHQSLPVIWLPGVGVRILTIRDHRLAQACKRFLDHRGARRFATIDELLVTAAAERWPEWDKHVPAEFRA
jgi:hypothetical protein